MESSVPLHVVVVDTPAEAHRRALRARLIAARSAHAHSQGILESTAALQLHLRELVGKLHPDCLGLYWPVRSEFNALPAFAADQGDGVPAKALPYTAKSPPRMHFRRWDGSMTLSERDECNIPVSSGAEVVPDVLLVPCVGYTRGGYRLGYGGGYFDRYMATYPHVTAIGVAWSFQQLDDAEFAAEPHDRRLTLVITERGVV